MQHLLHTLRQDVGETRPAEDASVSWSLFSDDGHGHAADHVGGEIGACSHLDNVHDGVHTQAVQGWQEARLYELLCLLYKLVICYGVLLRQKVHRGRPKARLLQLGNYMYEVYLIALPA